MEGVAFEESPEPSTKDRVGGGTLVGGGLCVGRVWKQKSGDVSREQ